ncbi:hypothetical protein [Komagataeibacter medellinensis]|uniref:hypothetical protein n=1 Tax=Komagataeibacter medellinensis TaxID=1177712 RepID=UPI001E4593CA|nr:hypothetical protein [Komagataeibacter medellinensis]
MAANIDRQHGNRIDGGRMNDKGTPIKTEKPLIPSLKLLQAQTQPCAGVHDKGLQVQGIVDGIPTGMSNGLLYHVHVKMTGTKRQMPFFIRDFCRWTILPAHEWYSLLQYMTCPFPIICYRSHSSGQLFQKINYF